MRNIFAVFKAVVFLLNCLWIIPVQSVILLITKGPVSYICPRLWHKVICRAFGIKIETVGTPVTNRQTLYMSNHVSHLDITLLGSLVLASFVSKAAVEDWPVFGYLGSLQQTVYIKRKRTEAGVQKNVLQERINKGDSLIIFPEGTSTDGRDVLPFKSSLFSLAMDVEDLCVQPVTIKIMSVDGKNPDAQEVRDIYAWHINMDTPLFTHMATFAKTRGAHIKVTFHEPLDPSQFKDRKELAKLCHDTVLKGL